MVTVRLYTGNTAWIFTFYNVLDFFWKSQNFLIYDFPVGNNINCNIVVDKSQHIQIDDINRAFDFDNILFSLFITFGIFDNSNAAVQFVQF